MMQGLANFKKKKKKKKKSALVECYTMGTGKYRWSLFYIRLSYTFFLHNFFTDVPYFWFNTLCLAYAPGHCQACVKLAVQNETGRLHSVLNYVSHCALILQCTVICGVFVFL